MREVDQPARQVGQVSTMMDVVWGRPTEAGPVRPPKCPYFPGLADGCCCNATI